MIRRLHAGGRLRRAVAVAAAAAIAFAPALSAVSSAIAAPGPQTASLWSPQPVLSLNPASTPLLSLEPVSLFSLQPAQAQDQQSAPASGAQPAPAPAPRSPVTLEADRVEYDTQTGIATADGHVRVTRGTDVITADHLVGNLTTGDIEATGHVTLSQPGRTATGESLRYNFRTRVGRMEQMVTHYGPWYLRSTSLELTSGGQGVASTAYLTPCDPQHPFFHVTARRVVVYPGDHLTAYDASLYIYGVRVVTLPQYTASLKPQQNTRSGPSIGYNNLDGAWIEYSQFFPVGTASNEVRVRYGTRSGVSGEDILSQQAEDHLWSLHLGRTETFDQNGNQFNLDQYSLDLVYDTHRFGSLPIMYTLEGHIGSYAETVSGVSTTRGEMLLGVSTDVFPLAPHISWTASASARWDTYGTGQQRTVVGFSVAVLNSLDASNLITLTYNYASVSGATPFSFDLISPASAVSLSYSYSGAGFLQTGGLSVTYDFIAQQTTVAPSATFQIAPTTLLSVAAAYNVTLQQWTEVDYAVTTKCDCLSLGLLYRTFPNPASNQLFVTIGLTPFPETFNTVRVY